MGRKRLYAVSLIITAIVTLTSCGIGQGNERLSGDGGGGGNDLTLGLTVYFIDVGQADSTLVVCDGAAMLIDGGNAADSDLIYAFLKNHGISHLEYIVGTHAHEDHIGGLAGALNYAVVDTAYCPVTDHDSEVFADFVKYLEKQNKSITVPIPGDTFQLGGADVEIIAPINPSDNPNNTSIVLRLTYGEVSFLFTGDSEREEEADILDSGYDVSADVLKVGHHGSETSTSYPFLREIMPRYAVISCGMNNIYGHPDEDTLSRLRDADALLYRTDTQGTITATSDGKTVVFST
jgi:competence protein ComEC